MMNGETKAMEAMREEARAEAVARIKRTLNSAEEPERVESLKQARQAQLSTAEAKLANTLSRTVGSVADSRRNLHEARDGVHHLHNSFEQVLAHCHTSSSSGLPSHRPELTTFVSLQSRL